jgi:hypothetical protein
MSIRPEAEERRKTKDERRRTKDEGRWTKGKIRYKVSLRWADWVKWGSIKRASSCLKTSKVVEKLRKIWKNVWKSEKNV